MPHSPTKAKYSTSAWAIVACRACISPASEQLGLFEVLGRHLHQIDARRRRVRLDHLEVVLVVLVAAAGAYPRLVRTGLVGVEQRAALIQPQALASRPARPL